MHDSKFFLAARLLYKPDPVPRMNSRDMETYCAGINAVLWDTADKLLARATTAVDETADGNLDRDHIHMQPFTERLTKNCIGTTRIDGTNAEK